MVEELEGGGAGAVADATGGPADATITEAGSDGSGEGAKRVDLTTLPEFRSWQAARDRKEAGYQQQLTAAQRQASEAAERARALEERMAEAQLQDADPADVHRFYQERERKRQVEYERQAQVQAVQQAAQARAGEFLDSVGLTPDTPGLDWTGGPTEAGLVTLMESAGRVLSLRAGELARQTATTATAAAREAKREALVESGAAQVSTSLGGTSTSLQAEYEAKKKGIRRGDVGAVVRLQTEYRKKGLVI